MRLLGLSIHHGYSAEAHVFATLLGYRQGSYDATVLYNCWPGARQGVEKFEARARARVVRIDTGWRPNADGTRSLAGRLSSVARICLRTTKLLRIARDYKPDVIYSCQQTWDNLTASYIARRLRKPQVIHLHYTIDGISPRNRFQAMAVDRLRTCDHVVTVSDFIRNTALEFGIPGERVTTILNSMEPARAAPGGAREAIRRELDVPEDAPLIGIIARLDPWKGQSDTIAAFATVADRFPTSQLVIVGDGGHRQELEAQAAACDLPGRIIFTGRRSDVPRLLAAMDIFAHPSRRDPCPLAVLEATAAGLPVVAYAEGGICETIRDGEAGILTPPGDVQALGDALSTLLADPNKARAMGAAGQARAASEFQPERAAESLAMLLKKVAKA